VAVFAAYFPFASRYSLDVPVLWNWYGLKDIWEEAYAEVEGVTWLSTGSWDPCNFATTKPIRSLEDLKGLRVYTFPTGGRFMQQFGVVPVTLPYGMSRWLFRPASSMAFAGPASPRTIRSDGLM
jgi:TRAP-type C4-dicarboxylate transport system substrate-binding protein